MAINLKKGQKISLVKKTDAKAGAGGDGGGQQLTDVCVGLNWGAIDKKVKAGGFLGFGAKDKIVKEAVDLDASCAVFDAQKQLMDVVFFNNLMSKDRAIRHSGDDRTGDMDGDDGLDNEVISVNLKHIHPSADQIVFFLNSFEGHDFAKVPFASIRIYEGTPTVVKNTFATFNIAQDNTYAGHVSMIMGKFYKRNGEWKFNAIGEPTRDRDLKQTLLTVIHRYV